MTRQAGICLLLLNKFPASASSAVTATSSAQHRHHRPAAAVQRTPAPPAHTHSLPAREPERQKERDIISADFQVYLTAERKRRRELLRQKKKRQKSESDAGGTTAEQTEVVPEKKLALSSLIILQLN